ncbi:MAG: ABC transporter substrate-binding protein [Ilumatobacteraceae bacterium]
MMQFKKIAAFTIVGGFLLGACGSDEKKADTTTAASGSVDCKPVKAGVLSVVTSLPGPNFWGTDEVDPTAITTGIEHDLAVAIATECGLKMEVRNESFDAIVAGQIAGESYDIALSQVTITADREKVVDFSVPYFKADQGILVQKGTKVASFDDLKTLNVGVQQTTTAEYYFLEVPEWSLGKDPQSFPDLISAYGALDAGQVDAIVIDTPINLGQASQSGGKLEVVAQIATGEEYGAIYPEGSPKKAIFDGIIKALVDDGSVNGYIAKYLGGDPSTVPFIKVGA